MLVFVINQHGEALMPCKQSKARKLLNQKKAKIINYKPFTIQLMYGSSNYTQEVKVGVDLGAKYIGIGIQSENKVIAKGTIELRQDIKENIIKRSINRRARRIRKTRYRKARFLNKAKNSEWMPPSICSRIDSTFRWIDNFISILPNINLTIETWKNDIENIKILNTNDKNNKLKQQVYKRDSYTCRICGESGSKKLNIHHIVYRSNGGANNYSNLITICKKCHSGENHKKGNVLSDLSKTKKFKYKHFPFMSIISSRVKIKYKNANFVEGDWTSYNRNILKLDKQHYNDALILSGIKLNYKDSDCIFYIKQFRKKKRSLHESIPRKGRKERNKNSKRNKKNTPYLNGFYLNDKVYLLGKIGWISGFNSRDCYIKDIQNNYITLPNKKYKQVPLKQIKFICHNNNWQYCYPYKGNNIDCN